MQEHFVLTDANSGSAALEEKIIRFARVPHYVLITGERGTGKTTIARQLHRMSSRSKREFVSVNCASFAAELLESELFGYERGAFTGAIAPKAGLFEISNGGTLFLDEIGELSLGLQAKLLKAVEEKRIRRVGGLSEKAIDVRIIAATSRDLQAMVRDGQFRPDLYDRLNILQLETIPLRYQKDRIEEILKQQLEEERIAIGRATPFVIKADAVIFLQHLDWLGNYRELRNFVARLAVEAMEQPAITFEIVRSMVCSETDSESPITVTDGNEPTTKNVLAVLLDPNCEDLETIYLKSAVTFIKHGLSQPDGSIRTVAKAMGASHTTIARILKRHDERAIYRVRESSSSGMAYAAAA